MAAPVLFAIARRTSPTVEFLAEMLNLPFS